MKKFAFGWFVAFVAIALFVGAVPAEAQYGYQNEVGALVQGNLNLVSGLHSQLDRARWESQAHGLVFHNGYYYGIAGRERQPQQQPYHQQAVYPPQGHGQLVPAPMPEQEPAPNLGAEPWPEQNQTEPAIPNVQMKNCTRVRGELYDWDTPTGVWLEAGQTVSMPASSRGGYRLLAEISSGGGTIRSWADSRYQDSTDSVLFVEPTRGGAR